MVEGCSDDLTTLYPAAADITELLALDGINSITDNCTATADLTVTVSETSTGSCPIVVTRTYTVTDGCSLSSTINQTINVKDTTNPKFDAAIVSTYPASHTSNCEYSYPDLTEVVRGYATDNCTDAAALTITQAVKWPMFPAVVWLLLPATTPVVFSVQRNGLFITIMPTPPV